MIDLYAVSFSAISAPWTAARLSAAVRSSMLLYAHVEALCYLRALNQKQQAITSRYVLLQIALQAAQIFILLSIFSAVFFLPVY